MESRIAANCSYFDALMEMIPSRLYLTPDTQAMVVSARAPDYFASRSFPFFPRFLSLARYYLSCLSSPAVHSIPTPSPPSLA